MIGRSIREFLSRSKPKVESDPRLAGFELKSPVDKYRTFNQIGLYRYLADNIPILNGAVWLWTRLCAAPIEIGFPDLPDSTAERLKNDLNRILSPFEYQKSGGIDSLLSAFFRGLFLDGCFGGEAVLNAGRTGLARFQPIDPRRLEFEKTGRSWTIFHDTENGRIRLDPMSYFHVGLDSTADDPRGRSLLASVGFVSHLERKLITDMSGNLEKAGYNRIQVQLKKPEKYAGESDGAYIQRANQYFDNTVELFKSLRPSDSAVTWDDVVINSVGPANQGTVSSWYLYHRALVEDICAGVHLDPFMLGYSYGTTQTWAKFKFELMMRQIVAVQEKAIGFFRWLIGLELALRGHSGRIAIAFDNRRVFGSLERFQARKTAVESVIAAYQAGLTTKEEARAELANIEPAIL